MKIDLWVNFKNIYIPPAGHDAGTSIGSALFYYNQVKNKPRFKAMFNPYLGSKSNNRDIENLLIEDSGTGVAVKDGSEVFINKVSIKNILYDGFMTYIKKDFFKNYTQLSVENIIEINNLGGSLCIRQENTFAKIENKICDESFVDVKNLYQNGRMKK
mgnify:CR=1 FL=1